MLKITYLGSQNLPCQLTFFLPCSKLSFCLVATYNAFPFPSNLLRWHLPEEPSCFLCRKEHCRLADILVVACKISLHQGRFTYQHDSVILKLIDSLKAFMNGIPNKAKNFVKYGTLLPKWSFKFVFCF